MKKIELAYIIDDDAIHQLLIKKHLENTGLVEQHVVSENGKQAYEDLKSRIEENSKLPEIIFLDLQMPIWDGWQFLEEFQKLDAAKDSQIFIVTSSVFENDFKKAKMYNLEDKYLVKPINTEKLKECIVRVLND
jgi:CheY-like chemotaxis protein